MVKHREGGDPSSSRKSPGRTEFEAITLERGVTHDTEFETGPARSGPSAAGLGAEVSLKDFRKDLIVELYNEAGQLAIAYKVYRCWVSEYQARPDLDANANAVADPAHQARERGLGTRCRRRRAQRAGPHLGRRDVMAAISSERLLRAWEGILDEQALERGHHSARRLPRRGCRVRRRVERSATATELCTTCGASCSGTRPSPSRPARGAPSSWRYRSTSACCDHRPPIVGPAPVDADGYVVTVRMPTTADLLSISDAADEESALAALVARCVESVLRSGRATVRADRRGTPVGAVAASTAPGRGPRRRRHRARARLRELRPVVRRAVRHLAVPAPRGRGVGRPGDPRHSPDRPGVRVGRGDDPCTRSAPPTGVPRSDRGATMSHGRAHAPRPADLAARTRRRAAARDRGTRARRAGTPTSNGTKRSAHHGRSTRRPESRGRT